jgi:hypothetical protein
MATVAALAVGAVHNVIGRPTHSISHLIIHPVEFTIDERQRR